MSGHIDLRTHVNASLDLTWEIAGVARAHDGRGEPVAQGGERVVGRVETPPDHLGRSWAYHFERTLDAERKTAYSRRWGNVQFRYSYAFWQYQAVDGGSEIRCVADFEMAPSSPVDDDEMQAIMAANTQVSMTAMAARVEAAAINRDGSDSMAIPS